MSAQVLLISQDASDMSLVGDLLAQPQNRQMPYAADYVLEWTDQLAVAQNKLAAGGIDAVLYDLHLSSDEDLDRLAKLCANAPHVPVIALADQDDPAQATQLLRAGAQDYLPRPRLTGEALLLVLHHAIERPYLDPDSDSYTVHDLVSDLAYMVRVTPGPEFTIEWVNKAFVQTVGLGLAEIHARGGWASLVHPADRARVEAWAPAWLSGKPDEGEFRILTASGQERWILSYTRPIWDSSHEHVVQIYGIAQDITDRKQAEIALAASLAQVERAKQEWESTADSLPQLICLLDSKGKVVRANRVVETWKLCSIHQIHGRSLHELLHPRCTDPNCALHRFWQAAWPELLAGQVSSHEYAYEDPILNRYLNLQLRPIAALREATASHATSAAVAVIDDITERKQAERALEQRTEQLQARNEELDAFAHTVAHDLKNPISLVIGYADILRQYRDTMSEQQIEGHLATVIQNGLKTISIIDELLLLAGARQMDITPSPIDMGYRVNSALQRLAMVIREKEAQVEMPNEWPVAVGYGPWIEEVWANYISNACKYGGDPPFVQLGATPEEGGTVCFWVKDNGQGLDEQAQQRLFAPFTRLEGTKGSGHGLGLSIVKRIMTRMGGTVGVWSQPGEGSTFYFCLPADK
jgi:PAS domain S-box-containing protein